MGAQKNQLHHQSTTAGPEGGRTRPTEGPAVVDTQNPEVPVRSRRAYTLGYKLEVLQKAAQLKGQGNGALGSYLRSKGLYYATYRDWVKQHDAGLLDSSLTGPKGKSKTELLDENKQLRRKLEGLEKRLAKTELIVEVQKKISQLMSIDTPDLFPGIKH